MVYLAELLVVVAVWLKTVRIRARNSYPVHGHKRIDNDTFLASLSPGKRPDGKGGKGEGMRKGEGNVK